MRGYIPSWVPSANHIDIDKARREDPDLMNRIAMYDPHLVIYHDSAVARWGIARLTPQGLRFIALWQTDEGLHLPFDNRILDALKKWDLRPNVLDAPKDANQMADRLDYEDERRAHKTEMGFDDDISHATRSNRRQLANALRRAYNLS